MFVKKGLLGLPLGQPEPFFRLGGEPRFGGVFLCLALVNGCLE